MTVVTTTGHTEFVRSLADLQDRIHLDLANMTVRIDGEEFNAGGASELKNELSDQLYKRLHIRNALIGRRPTTGEQDIAQQLILRIPHQNIWQKVDSGFSSSFLAQGDGYQVVKLNGIKVLVPESDVETDDGSGEVSVRLPSWRSRTTPGYLLALGETGINFHEKISRFYIGCGSAERALEAFPVLLNALAESGIGYHLKALSSSLAFPRSDAIVAYIPSNDAPRISELLVQATTNIADLAAEKSIFTEEISEVISWAVEPSDSRVTHRSLSFGQHRSRVLADSFFRSKRKQTDLCTAWKEEAALARVDPERPAFNV